ncbi:hypothetical protein M0R45_000979 [Rubus argutus]|uniref:Uncharacterized protein n=1 Tax=Rubus argutus TaxID=59490 RepID=A0AAW1VNH5_RUBAR
MGSGSQQRDLIGRRWASHRGVEIGSGGSDRTPVGQHGFADQDEEITTAAASMQGISSADLKVGGGGSTGFAWWFGLWVFQVRETSRSGDLDYRSDAVNWLLFLDCYGIVVFLFELQGWNYELMN